MRDVFHMYHMFHMSHVLSLISLTPPQEKRILVIDISNTPRKRSEFERTESLFFSIENLNELKGLVKMSASWSLV